MGMVVGDKTLMGFKFTLSLLLGLFLLLPVQAQEKLITDRVFHIPDPKSQNIQFQMIVLAGSADESNMAQLGIAHYLEHLVLVGRNEGQAESAQRFFADGNSNGWTSQRNTGYIHSFPANAADRTARLERLFKFYSERLTDFAITPEDAIRERNVVRQEHDWRYGSSPQFPVWQQATRYIYEGHPFANWTIGTPETIAAFTVEESRAFLRRWYRKGNVYFIVTGPVAAEEIKTIAEKYLSTLDATPPPERAWPSQKLKVQADSRVFQRADKRITTPSISLSRMVNANEADPLRQSAIASLVSNYLASKLTGSPHSALVEGDAPVSAAITSAQLERSLPGLLTLSLGAVPEEGRSIGDVRLALADYTKAFVKRGIDAPTLERLKRRFARDTKRSLEEPQNAPSRLIGWLTRPLPYDRLKDWPDIVASISVEEINTALAAFAGDSREAITIFEPGSE